MQRTLAAAQTAALALCMALPPAAHGGVIPLPAKTVHHSGYFEAGAATVIYVAPGDPDTAAAAQYLAALWQRSNNLTLAISTALPAAASVITFHSVSNLGAEGYQLDVAPHKITVSASTAAGLFYGAITLWQLLPPAVASGRIEAQTITDEPRFRWRGILLDSARHFQSPDFIHAMIDWMAWHKLNVLQWHLTDDQGWRLEIKKYLRLTSVGAWRVPALVPGQAAAPRYGGFYTQAQVRSIVAFAATRHVQIIPEIDMPAHAQAAIAAYPELGNGKEPLAVSNTWGVHTPLMNGEPATLLFLEDVLTEVMRLFPSTDIHVGGGEEQTHFTAELAKFLSTHGRRLIGNDATLASTPALSFDRRQSTLASEPPGRLELNSLEDVYRFDPATARPQVLGVQAEIWTEHISSDKRVEWMALPRAAALAEIAWSTAPRNWPDFLQRLAPMFARYRAADLAYADSVFAIDSRISRSSGGFTVKLSNQAADARSANVSIRYTLDGRDPTASSMPYAAPLQIAVGTELRAAAFVSSEQVSRVWSQRIDDATGLRRDTHDLELCSNRVGLLLQPHFAEDAAEPPVAVDIMNPCWIERGVDLSQGPGLVAAVTAAPFNYEIGADAAATAVAGASAALGELQIRVDGCETPLVAALPLPAPVAELVTLSLPQLPRIQGRHDLCLKFVRPQRDPLWLLDWVQIGKPAAARIERQD